MFNETIAFLIFITNPTGVAVQLAYPIVAYEKFVEEGETAARQYKSMQACEQRLQQLGGELAQKLKANARNWMPEYQMVMHERAKSLQCMPADAKPDARLRGQQVGPVQFWRIGQLDRLGYFEGQTLEPRYFSDEQQCDRAYNALISNYIQAAHEKKWQEQDIQYWLERFRASYRCMLVPDDRYSRMKQKPVVVLPPGVIRLK